MCVIIILYGFLYIVELFLMSSLYLYRTASVFFFRAFFFRYLLEIVYFSFGYKYAFIYLQKTSSMALHYR